MIRFRKRQAAAAENRGSVIQTMQTHPYPHTTALEIDYFGLEVDAYSAEVAGGEQVLYKPEEEAGLAHACVHSCCPLKLQAYCMFKKWQQPEHKGDAGSPNWRITQHASGRENRLPRLAGARRVTEYEYYNTIRTCVANKKDFEFTVHSLVGLGSHAKFLVREGRPSWITGAATRKNLLKAQRQSTIGRNGGTRKDTCGGEACTILIRAGRLWNTVGSG